jgi:hypothetical protein
MHAFFTQKHRLYHCHMRESLCYLRAIILTASFFITFPDYVSSISNFSCRVTFGDSSGSQPISILQVLVQDGLNPCTDAILTRVDASLFCELPMLSPMNIWPMFVWKSHEHDVPKHISSINETEGRSISSMVVLVNSPGAQRLSIPVLIPPSCCGVGQLQASRIQFSLMNHP